jgi:hypothetical protein
MIFLMNVVAEIVLFLLSKSILDLIDNNAGV